MPFVPQKNLNVVIFIDLFLCSYCHSCVLFKKTKQNSLHTWCPEESLLCFSSPEHCQVLFAPLVKLVHPGLTFFPIVESRNLIFLPSPPRGKPVALPWFAEQLPIPPLVRGATVAANWTSTHAPCAPALSSPTDQTSSEAVPHCFNYYGFIISLRGWKVISPLCSF